MGIAAAVLPFTHADSKKSTCPFTAGVAVLACAYLFYDKHMN